MLHRFIDDIAMLWFHGDVELQLFLQWINTLHPTIKFTANYGVCSIPYLDVALSIVDHEISTDLHSKPTDANMCLPFHSCHPRHCTRSIPISQCLRIRRICSRDTTYIQRAAELKEKLQKRGYPDTLLDSAIQKVAAIPRHRTLDYTDKQQTDRVPVVITHNPANPPLAQWLKEYMPILHSSIRMQKAVPIPPIIGERNCRSLRRILMPSKLPKIQQQQQTEEPGKQQPKKLHWQQQSNQEQQPPDEQQQPDEQQKPDEQTGQTTRELQQQYHHQQQQQHRQQHHQHPTGEQQQQQYGCHTCNAKRCVVCQYHLKTTNTFESVVNGGKHAIKSQVSCSSQNLVYLIDCSKCYKAQYVGETGQTLKKRLYGHRHNILRYETNKKDNNSNTSKYTKEDTMVAKHFNLPHHSLTDMKCTVIEKICTDDASLRKRREKFWRHQLQTNFPDGLNVFD